MGTGAVRALFTACPTSDRQAATWRRIQDYLQNRDQRDALRAGGIGADTVAAQRRAQGSRYLHVRDWSELDGFDFRCRTTRTLAKVLLSLIAFKKVSCVTGSYGRLAAMLGAFGHPCSAGSVRNAVAELRPLGLTSLSMCETHPEGFRCRPDRLNSDMRQTCEHPEAAPLYVLSGTLALMVGALAVRSAGLRRKLEQVSAANDGQFPASSRLPFVDNLPRAFPTEKTLHTSRHRTTKRTAEKLRRPWPAPPKERPSAGHPSISQRRLSGAQKLSGKGLGGLGFNSAAEALQRPVVRRSPNPSARRPSQPQARPEAVSGEPIDLALQRNRAGALADLLAGTISRDEFTRRANLPSVSPSPRERIVSLCPPDPTPSEPARSGLSSLQDVLARIDRATAKLDERRRGLLMAATDRVLALLRAGEISFRDALRLLEVQAKVADSS